LSLALSCSSSLALSLQDSQDPIETSDAAAIDSEQTNSAGISDVNFSIVNLHRFALENPIDPQIGFLTRNIATEENASVNLTQMVPGAHFGAHYHRGLDEIDYVIQGRANVTLNGRDYPVQAGDLIYIRPFAVHDFTALGNETFQNLVVFAPAFDGKDRVYV
jgi:mannose-6-phosphate isomerase-like protein (cupin superfamily)